MPSFIAFTLSTASRAPAAPEEMTGHDLVLLRFIL